MKKFILFISILVFSFSFCLLCYAQDEQTKTYSLTTNIQYYADHTDDRISLNITINNLEERYVVIPYFKYSPGNSPEYYYLSCSMALYDKQEDITYIPNRSTADNKFIGDFYKSGKITVIGPYGNNSSPGMSTRCTVNDLGKPDITSDNYKLPFYVSSDYTKGNYPFNLSDVQNKGTWFIVGNNYPFPNPVYSTDIYYPSLFSLQFTMNETLSYRFGFELQGTNIVYTNLDNYYLEIFASTNNDDTVIYQSSYKITDLYSDWYQSHKVYSVIDNFFNIFPNMNPHQEFTVFVRCRYMDNNVNLVSKYQFYVQPNNDIENPDTPKFFQGEGDIPTNLAPGSIQDASYPQSSFDGNYNFGDFNALNFVKGGGGLPSLVNGVSTVFSFLPPWLWQMMWYILGALAVIALLKVVIS